MIIFFTVLTILSRGILEMLFDLKAAYLIQFIALLVFFIIAKPNFIEFYKKYLTIIIIYSILSCISVFITFYQNNNLIGIFYFLANIFIFIILYVESHSDAALNIKYKIISSLIISSMLLVFFSYIQYLELFEFPGKSTIDGIMRTSSLTGSYLHYPLIISICSLMSLQIYIVKKEIIYLLCFIVLLLATFISYSRSGPMIIIFGFLIYYFKNIKYLIIFLFVVFIFLFGFENVYSDRVLSSIDINSLGNSGRLSIWLDGINNFYNSYWIFSNHAGYYSNVSKNLSDFNYNVLESTFLQQLANFGIINAIIYYYILLKSYFKISREYRLLRGLCLACILETLIYQSGEVLPFIFIFGMLPLVAAYLDAWRDSKLVSQSY